MSMETLSRSRTAKSPHAARRPIKRGFVRGAARIRIAAGAKGRSAPLGTSSRSARKGPHSRKARIITHPLFPALFPLSRTRGGPPASRVKTRRGSFQSPKENSAASWAPREAEMRVARDAEGTRQGGKRVGGGRGVRDAGKREGVGGRRGAGDAGQPLSRGPPPQRARGAGSGAHSLGPTPGPLSTPVRGWSRGSPRVAPRLPAAGEQGENKTESRDTIETGAPDSGHGTRAAARSL